jgi:23S rRNA (cytidine2498-2'-O)-methyltransferase
LRTGATAASPFVSVVAARGFVRRTPAGEAADCRGLAGVEARAVFDAWRVEGVAVSAGAVDVGVLRRVGVLRSGLALVAEPARVLRVGVVAKDDEPVEGGGAAGQKPEVYAAPPCRPLAPVSQPPDAAPVSLTALWLLCRAGFEAELAAELRAGGVDPVLAVTTAPALVQLNGPAPALSALCERLRAAPPVFARDVLPVIAVCADLPRGNRIEALRVALRGEAYAAAEVIAPDTPEAGPLAPMLKAVAGGLNAMATPEAPRRLRVIFADTATAAIGWVEPGLSAAAPGGILRLKFPAAAPSRSTLKLEEALLTLLTPAEREARLKPGMRAVDLGASPGGWTFQLVQRQISVTAIDNGRMDAALLASGRVNHLRVDAFGYRPAQPVDWLLCDVIEAPRRIAALIAEWFRRGDTRAAIFNLKLPGRDRQTELARCLVLLRVVPGLVLRVRHLYHDREEVTVCALLPVAAGRAVAAPRGAPAPASRPRAAKPPPNPRTRRRGPSR